MKKIILLLFLLSATVVLLVGCGGDEELEAHDNVPMKEEGDVEEASTITYPLTGEVAKEQVNRRVIGVTINNHPEARPHSGIQAADLVYEVLSEGEVTRLVALFHSEYPERVGSVRSSRPYHIELVQGYGGLLVTHGWSPEAEQLLKAGRADYLNGLFHDGTLFQRSPDRKAPHNSYITFANIQKGLTDKGYTLEGDVAPFRFYEEGTEMEGLAIDELTINYFDRNRVTYRIQSESGEMTRYNEELQTIDLDTRKPVEVSNLFVVETDHRVLDDQGRREINLTSGGRGLLLQGGRLQFVEWRNENGRILPVQNGEIVPFLSGQTWINIVPTSPGLDKMVEWNNDEKGVTDDAN